MNGMSEDDFRSVLMTNYNLLNSSKYNFVNYDFEIPLHYDELESDYDY